MRTRDIMTRTVHTINTDTPIEQIAALLAQKHITAAPVLDEQGHLVGIVSETDLLERRLLGAAGAPALWDGDANESVGRPKVASDVMTQTVVTVSADTNLGEAAERMLDSDVHSMPVVKDGVVLGMISRSDLLRSLVRTDDVIAAEVQHRLDEYSGGTRRWTATVTDGDVTIHGQFDDNVEKDVVTILSRTVLGVRTTGFSTDHRQSTAAAE